MRKHFIARKLYRKLRKSFSLQKPRINEWMTRPFESKDLLPVSEDWRVAPPDFIGIASGKAGTTWWYRLLLEHPSVEPNRLAKKELSYFPHFGYHNLGSRAIETYRQAFAAPRDCICGEWSPGYLNYPLVIDQLARVAPEAKLLAIVRNPVDRVLSAMNQMLSGRAQYINLTKGEPAYVFKIYSLFPEAIQQSSLYEPFRHLLKIFDRSQLLLLQFEQCKMNPSAEISKTYRFLGLDDSYSPVDLNRKVNARPYIVPKLKPDERTILADYFSDDVHSFAKLFPEIDLSLWPDFEIQMQEIDNG